MTAGAISPADSEAAKCELACEILRTFGTLRFSATGWSMLPAIWPGETLVVERVPPDQVRVGEVVLTGRGGRLCAHRVVALPEDSGSPQWTTQGDAMPKADRPAKKSELLGRVAHVVRAGEYVAIPRGLSLIHRLIARVIRRSNFAARVLVYSHNRLQNRHKNNEEILPCQC